MIMTWESWEGGRRVDGRVGRGPAGRQDPARRKGKGARRGLLHYGCVPSKTLIHTAHVYHLMKNAGRFGLPPVEAGPVDFGR